MSVEAECANQGAIQMKSRAQFLQEEINRQHDERGVDG
jgi:hypothetical protein